MLLDPRIGILNGGKFYCFPRGYHNPEFKGSLAEVEHALGLSKSSAPVKAAGNRMFIVTVTPTVVTYAGCSAFGEYTIEVYAANQSAAISKARQERNLEEGRHGVKATYRAKLAGN